MYCTCLAVSGVPTLSGCLRGPIPNGRGVLRVGKCATGACLVVPVVDCDSEVLLATLFEREVLLTRKSALVCRTITGAARYTEAVDKGNTVNCEVPVVVTVGEDAIASQFSSPVTSACTRFLRRTSSVHLASGYSSSGAG